MIFKISHKTLTGSKPLRIRFYKGDGFIRIFDGTRYLTFFSSEKYDAIYNKIRYFINLKSVEIEVDSYDSLPMEKSIAFAFYYNTYEISFK